MEPKKPIKLEDLSDSQQRAVTKLIVEKYDRFKTKKAAIEKQWEVLTESVFGSSLYVDSRSKNQLIPAHSYVHNTILGHIWARSLQTPQMQFNVEGLDENSQTQAPLYKAVLEDFCNRDKLWLKLDQQLQLDGIIKGVCIGMVAYKECIEECTAPVSEFLKGNLKHIEPDSIQDTDEGLVRYKKKVYDGATFKRMDPYRFVFDSNEDFDTTFKCYSENRVLEDLEADGIYSNLDKIKFKNADMAFTFDVKNTTNYGTTTPESSILNNKGYDPEGRVETLTFYGNLRIPAIQIMDDVGITTEDHSSIYLRNYKIVIGARREVIFLDVNPYGFNPFIKWCYRETEDGWGQSILTQTMPLVDASANLLNMGERAAELAINPPCYAPSGMFDTGTLNLDPGQIIYYKPNPALPQVMPEPIKIQPNIPFEYLQWFEQTIEATTGATRQLSGSGAPPGGGKTATEFSGLQQAGNMILDRVVDTYNIGYKLPVIEKFAKLQGYFNPISRQVPVQSANGSSKLQRVDSAAYFGDYQFTLADAKSEQERKGILQDKLQFVELLMKDPEMNQRIKKVELAGSIFSDMGEGDPDHLFYNDQEMTEHLQQMAQFQQVMQQPPQPSQGPITVNENEKIGGQASDVAINGTGGIGGI